MTNKEHYYQHAANGLCITMAGLTWLGFNENTLWKASSRGSKAWPFIDHPEDGRMKLVVYDELKENKKAEITERLRKRMGCKCTEELTCLCGDIYSYTVTEPIRKMIVKDLKAESFYMAYRYKSCSGIDGVDALSAERVRHYTQEASILNMIVKATGNAKDVIKKGLNISIDDFWKHIARIIEVEKSKEFISNKFPSSYRNLSARVREYNTDGYEVLIHGNAGKQNAAKVSDEVAKAFLLSLIAHPLQHDDFTIMLFYNQWAKANGRAELIADGTVGVYRRNNATEIDILRYGNKHFTERHNKEIAGFKPTAPLYLVEHDDNHLDLLFTDWNDASSSKHYHRFKAYVVTDSFNRLPLGKMYAENVSTELVRAAYVDAMYYIRSLTGAWYLPHELKSDNFGVQELEPFYKNIGHFHRTPVGSKQRGYIEQSFGDAHWRRCIKLSSDNNYTGNNITALNRGVNIEWLDKNKKDYPAIQESTSKIEYFFHLLRNFPQSTNGKTKEAEWLEAWQQLPEADKRPISDEQFLMIFGIAHRPHGRTNTIDTAGIEFTLNGQHRKYTLPEDIRFNNVGKSVTILYDPMDFSRILITDNDKLRCVATETRLMPRAIRDYKQGDRTYFNQLMAEKIANVGKVTAKNDKRKQVLVENNIDTETFFQIGSLVKELKMEHETRAIMNRNEETREFNPIELM